MGFILVGVAIFLLGGGGGLKRPQAHAWLRPWNLAKSYQVNVRGTCNPTFYPRVHWVGYNRRCREIF